MPTVGQTKEVRAHARKVAKRMNLEPWYENQAAVLAVVGRELGLELVPREPSCNRHYNKPGGKRKRDGGNECTTECSVCMTATELVTLVPCGHRRTCMPCLNKCATRDPRCPVCRSRWTAVLEKIYD